MIQPGVPPATPATDPAHDLAEEVLARFAEGEAVDLAAVASRLPDDTLRRRFLQLVEDAQRVQDLLPRVLRPGAVLAERYRLVREIGSGGMGRVFEALDVKLGRRVAVKVLTAVGAQAFDPERQFLNEAVLLAGLQHPNIVAVHELGTHADQPFFVMDLVEGTPLSDVLDFVRAELRERGEARPRAGALLAAAIGRPLPAGRRPQPAGDDWFRVAARVALELARTLEAAHERGIVHRDLKPQNVLLRGDATPVVLDFGLAGTRDRAGQGVTRGLFGTVAYLAPEQVNSGRVGADPRTDVYQLGLLLYELLVLQRAFPGDELSAQLGRVGRGEFLRPRAIDRGVPAELEAVCLKAMELDPARRYPTVTALREDLQRWVEDGLAPLASRGGSLASGLRRARYAVRRHPLGLAVAGTAAVALLAWLVLRPPAPAWAGEMVPTSVAAGDRTPQLLTEGGPVHPGDALSVSLRADEPAYVYALSVFGADEPREFIAPMTLMFVDKEPHDAPDRWGRLVAPGESAACTRVDPNAVDGQHEGLLVFASPNPQPKLAAWMDELNRVGSLSPDGAVPYAEARAAVDGAPPATRGVKIELTEAERLALTQIDAAALLGEKDWSLPDPHRWEFRFVVRR
ncbi:MAG TPA: serine/threonine-protein kinase [Planctomycetota bacterium]|nr:serine/threonine-protein kinase [Planctomycetota bacterium]